MNKLVIWVIVIAVVLGVFIYFMNRSPDLAPKSAAKKASSGTQTNPFGNAVRNSMTALEFGFMVDTTDSFGSSNMPASGLVMIAKSGNSQSAVAFSNALTKSNENADVS